MKNTLVLRNLILILAVNLAVSGCKKDRTVVYVDDKKPVVSTTWSASVAATDDVEKLKKELKPTATKHQFYVNGYNWNYVYVNSKFQLFVPGSGWKDASGNSVTGSVNAEIIFIDKAGKNIINSKPTQTDAALLRTGGSYSVSFTQNGQQVTNDGYYFANINGINKSAYSLFEAADGTNWKEINDGVSGRVDNPWSDTSRGLDSMRGFMKDTMFRLKCKYRWVNCDFYSSISSTTMVLKLKLPEAYGNLNTSVWVVDKVNSVVTVLYGNPTDKIFQTGPNYKFPVGFDVTMVAMVKIGTKYYYAQKDITTTEGKIEEMTPVEKTKQEISDLLDGL